MKVDSKNICLTGRVLPLHIFGGPARRGPLRKHSASPAQYLKAFSSALLLAAFCAQSVTAWAETTVDRVVAVVNQDVITLFDLDKAMAPRLSEIRKAANFDLAYQEAKQQVLEQLID